MTKIGCMKKMTLFSILMLTIQFGYCQNSILTLTFFGKDSTGFVSLDSIYIQNKTTGSDTILSGDNPILIINPSLSIPENNIKSNFSVDASFPNPFDISSTIHIIIKNICTLSFTLADINGKMIAYREFSIGRGTHRFSLQSENQGILFLTVTDGTTSKTMKLINNSNSFKPNKINYEGIMTASRNLKESNITGFTYHYGEQLLFTSYKNKYHNSTIIDSPNNDTIYTFNLTAYAMPFVCGQGVLYEGLSYPTIEIGTQCWFKKNLNVGTQISHFQNMTDNGVKEKWCYDNLTASCNIYGGLYQWNEVMQYLSLPGAQGLCPTGWHIPSKDEWDKLISLLGGTSNAGGKLKEQGTTHWLSPNTGASNSSGFAALGNGSTGTGPYPSNDLKLTSTLWSSTEFSSTVAYYCKMYYDNKICEWPMPNYGYFWKDGGAGIRCIKNGSIIITTDNVTNINQSTATCGGNVISDGSLPVINKGVCWSITNNPTILDYKSLDGSGTGPFVSQLTGLITGVNYFVRAYATNSEGTTYYGNEVIVPCIPTVTTASISEITYNSAKGGGNVTSNGGSVITGRGICWSTTPNPTLSNSHTSDGTGTGTFISYLNGLTENTQYYVRAYATNIAGTSYGDEVTFSTVGEGCPGIPFVEYEGKTYNTILIGSQCWFKENLNVGLMINVSQNQSNNGVKEKYCYNNIASNCNIYGGMYQWGEALQYSYIQGGQGLCPSGWHIPSKVEWNSLMNFLGGSSIAGGKMKEIGTAHWASPNTGATNSSRFTALPGGFFTTAIAPSFAGIQVSTIYWSSTNDGTTSWNYGLSNTSEGLYENYNTIFINDAISIRCIKD